MTTVISFVEHIDMRPGARVALGMSGGVDSSVSARLLMDAGFDVVGVTCVFVDDENARAAVADARCVAEKLGIEHVTKDCTRRFSCSVIDPFVDEYAAGRTPSPCVVCNRRCKIPSLTEAADELGCDFVATGHYAKVVRRRGRLAVACAAYLPKDQSYMLSMLSQDQLARLVLPLGSLSQGKDHVRALAAQWGLPVASKSDSQDICFIHGSHLDFLSRRGLREDPGDIVSLDGRVLGRHKGLHRYTIGQRKGLDIGGAPEPYYVVDKRVGANELVVAFASDAFVEGVRVAGMTWQSGDRDVLVATCAEGGFLPCAVKLRYRQKAASCRVMLAADAAGFAEAAGVAGVACAAYEGVEAAAVRLADAVDVVLDSPQAATAPGQYAVFYDGDVVLGAGVIESLRRCGDGGRHGEGRSS